MGNFSYSARRLFECSITLLISWIIAGAGLVHSNNKTAACQEEKTKCQPSDSEKRLFDAIAAGDSKQVESLLTAGANPDGRVKTTSDNYNSIKLCPSPLMHALRLGKTDILKLLLKASYKRDEAGIHSPAISADRYVIEMMIAPGGNVHSKAGDGATPLIIAARAGRIDLVRFLLETGANVNSRSNSGGTALIAAADRLGDSNAGFHAVNLMSLDKDKVCEILVAAGGDVNASNNVGDTPLILAAAFGRPNLVRFLLENGADVN